MLHTARSPAAAPARGTGRSSNSGAGGSAGGGSGGKPALPGLETLLLAIGVASVLAAVKHMQDFGSQLNKWAQQQWSAGAAHDQKRGEGAPATGAAAARKAAGGRRLSLSEADMFYFRLASSHVFD